MESGWKAVDVTPGYYYNVETLQKMVNTPEQIKKNAALKNNGYKVAGKLTYHCQDILAHSQNC